MRPARNVTCGPNGWTRTSPHPASSAHPSRTACPKRSSTYGPSRRVHMRPAARFGAPRTRIAPRKELQQRLQWGSHRALRSVAHSINQMGRTL
eukprot:4873479-Pyramimonas_sp.AAC.1